VLAYVRKKEKQRLTLMTTYATRHLLIISIFRFRAKCGIGSYAC